MLRNALTSFIALLALAACPGPVADPFPPYEVGAGDNRQMDARFAGDWKGIYTISIAGKAVDGAALLTAEVDGRFVTIAGVCPSGSEVITAEGNGPGTIWYGDLTCGTPFPQCPAAASRFRSAVVKVLDDGGMFLAFSGEMTGCGANVVDVTMVVRATK